MPSTSIDTFFACIIIVTAALIATASLASTMQTSINTTQNINKESYLKAISDHIVTNPGAPLNWGSIGVMPTDFGLAASPSTIPYELDLDKISRLNELNNYSLSYFDMMNSSRLSNIALGITVSQIMSINIAQSSNSTIGSETSFNFAILTSINSEPVSTSLHCYVIANNYLNEITNTTSDIGLGYLTIQIPSPSTDNAFFVVFARSSFDNRITSYAIYNFASSAQETTPNNEVLSLSPLNYSVSLSTNSSGLDIQSGYLFSYGYQHNIGNVENSNQYSIPKILDNSPFIIIIYGTINETSFQQWIAYPQIPLKAGSSFENSEQNVFNYIVTVNNVLYKLNISLGDVPQ